MVRPFGGKQTQRQVSERCPASQGLGSGTVGQPAIHRYRLAVADGCSFFEAHPFAIANTDTPVLTPRLLLSPCSEVQRPSDFGSASIRVRGNILLALAVHTQDFVPCSYIL